VFSLRGHQKKFEQESVSEVQLFSASQLVRE